MFFVSLMSCTSGRIKVKLSNALWWNPRCNRTFSRGKRCAVSTSSLNVLDVAECFQSRARHCSRVQFAARESINADVTPRLVM